FRGKRAELIDHRVDDVLDLKNLTADIDGDLLRQVARGNGRRDLGHVAQLHGQVAGHRVDAVRQILPRSGNALDVSLSAELAFGADLTRDASYLGGEGAELIDHRVDGVLQLGNLALDIDSDLLRQVAV